MNKLNGRSQTLLKQPLNPAYVSRFQKGDYISTSRVIKLANHIFGFGNWSAKTIECNQENITQVNGKHYATYSAIVEVTIHETNTVYSDVGVKTGIAKNLGDAIELAIKSARSVAFKRAMRHLGSQFGLDLYKNSDIQEMTEVTEEQMEYFYLNDKKEFLYHVEILKSMYKNAIKKDKDNKELSQKLDKLIEWSKKDTTLERDNIKKSILIIKKMQEKGV